MGREIKLTIYSKLITSHQHKKSSFYKPIYLFIHLHYLFNYQLPLKSSINILNHLIPLIILCIFLCFIPLAFTWISCYRIYKVHFQGFHLIVSIYNSATKINLILFFIIIIIQPVSLTWNWVWDEDKDEDSFTWYNGAHINIIFIPIVIQDFLHQVNRYIYFLIWTMFLFHSFTDKTESESSEFLHDHV